MVLRHLRCEACMSALLSDSAPDSTDYALIVFKDNGGLLYPSTSVVYICKLVEKQFSLVEEKQHLARENNFLQKQISMPVVMELLQSGH